MIKSSPQNVHGSISVTRYRFNLGLLVLLMILAMVWFQRHLQLYFAESLFVGGTLSVWALWKIVQSCFSWGFGEEAEGGTRRLLGRRTITEPLGFGLILIVFLHLTTSSIYFTYEGAKPGDSEFTIQVLHEQNPYLQDLTVTSYDRTKGQPFFLRFNTQPLTIRLSSAPEYKSQKIEFKAWSSRHLLVPADFELRTFHLVRLIPALGLNGRVPIKSVEESDYVLSIKRGDQEWTALSFKFETLYIGAQEADLKTLVNKQDAEAFELELNNYFTENGIPENARGLFFPHWKAKPREIPTEEFQPGDSIDILLTKKRVEQPILKQTVKISEDALQTVFLEMNVQ